MSMLSISGEIMQEAWISLRRSRTRSLLTMTGIVWGIVAVTLLIAYGRVGRYASKWRRQCGCRMQGD